MTDLVLGLIVGAAIALLVAGIGASFYVRRLTYGQERQLAALDTAVLELRQETAEDKETNRRLRHELAVKTPGHLLETATMAEMERDSALSERDQAIEQLELVQRDLAGSKTRLGDQEAKLRQYREALQEIRLSLEAQGRGRGESDADPMIGTDEITADDAAIEPDRTEPQTADLAAGD